MAHLLVVHDVENYATWKSAFDAHDSVRRDFGGGDYQLFHSADNPNQVVVLFEWDSHANAQRFAESDNLREAMQKAGVASRPQVYFLDEDLS